MAAQHQTRPPRDADPPHRRAYSEFKTNPEEFIAEASRLINEQKATVTIERLSYDPIEGAHDIEIFAHQKPHGDFGKAYKADRHVFDYVYTDSTNERKFVEELDKSQQVAGYAKLPLGFSIPTPVGDYNPDWAIGFQQGQVRHVYLIVETKGSMSSMELREIEQVRVECARRFFARITWNQVKYDVVDSFGKLMELVS